MWALRGYPGEIDLHTWTSGKSQTREPSRTPHAAVAGLELEQSARLTDDFKTLSLAATVLALQDLHDT